MQVFKSYLKILNKKKENILMYIGIFAGVLFGFILPNSNGNEITEYTSMKCSFAVFDYDNSEDSRAFVAYMEDLHTLVSIADDTKETMQDELFIRNVDCIIRIKKGFADGLALSDASSYLEVVAIPGRNKVELFESDIDRYFSYLNAYLAAGYPMADAEQQTVQALAIKTQVTLKDAASNTPNSKRYYFFSYLGWVFIVMIIQGVCPILVLYNRKTLRDRIAVSAYKYSRLTKELLLGTFVTGLGICVVFEIGGILACKGEMLQVSGFGNLLNMLCYMMISLAFAFLVSKLTDNEELFSMIGNIISLGMGFLSGIFVPMEYLGNGVITIAHFLPAYWYVKTVAALDNVSGIPSEAWRYMGIELLFAAAIVMIGIVADKAKHSRLAEE